jgi:hypothetical protein
LIIALVGAFSGSNGADDGCAQSDHHDDDQDHRHNRSVPAGSVARGGSQQFHVVALLSLRVVVNPRQEFTEQSV